MMLWSKLSGFHTSCSNLHDRAVSVLEQHCQANSQAAYPSGTAM